MRLQMKRKLNSSSSVWLYVQNRYFITGLFGLLWVSFISDIDLFFLMKSQRQLNAYNKEVKHFEERIDAMRLDLNDLSSDPLKLERFARERYFMKRPDEDLFRIIPAKDVSAS
jgi:hypothetical protein